jgi:hypothetical protein
MKRKYVDLTTTITKKETNKKKRRKKKFSTTTTTPEIIPLPRHDCSFKHLFLCHGYNGIGGTATWLFDPYTTPYAQEILQKIDKLKEASIKEYLLEEHNKIGENRKWSWKDGQLIKNKNWFGANKEIINNYKDFLIDIGDLCVESEYDDDNDTKLFLKSSLNDWKKLEKENRKRKIDFIRKMMKKTDKWKIPENLGKWKLVRSQTDNAFYKDIFSLSNLGPVIVHEHYLYK